MTTDDGMTGGLGDAVVELSPRPKVVAAVTLILVGSAMSIAGSFLPWWRAWDFTLSGNDILFGRSGGGYRQVHGPGHIVIALAAVTALLGITMLAVGRVLTAAIIAVVSSAVSFFFSLACLAIVQDTRTFLGGGNIDVGVPIAIVGSAAGLLGAVLATARRRIAVN